MKLWRFGVGVGAALARDPDTADLAPPVKAATKALAEARAEVTSAIEERTERSSELDVENGTVKRELERVEGAIAFHGPGVTRATLPDGLAAVAPRGIPQVEPMREMASRIETCAVPGADGLRALCLELVLRLLAELEKLQAALASADEALALARKRAGEARQGLWVALARARGALRERFPDNLDRQASYFPIVEPSSRLSDEGDIEEAEVADPDASSEGQVEETRSA